jgi:hypothetical protein
VNTSTIRDTARGNINSAVRWLTGLAALLLVFAFPIEAHAGTAAIDNSVQLDPFNPVPEIQFTRDGYCDRDCGGCRERCGERRCCEHREHRCVNDCDRGWRDCDHDCRYNAWRCDRGCRDGWRDSYRDCDHDCRYGAWNCDRGCRNGWRDGSTGWRDCEHDCRYGTWSCDHDCRNNWYGTGYRNCDRDCREGAWHCAHGCAETYRELVRDYDERGDRYDDQADKYDAQSEWYKHHVMERDHHPDGHDGHDGHDAHDGHDGHDGYDRHDVHGELLPPADVFPLEPAHDGYGYDRRDAPRSGYEGPGPYDDQPPGDYRPPN